MATKFSMKELNPPTWFSFNEADPESGRIAIRVLTTKRRQEIRKQCVTQRVEYKINQRFEVEQVDEEKFSRLLWDYCIADWERLEDDDGKPIECNADNKAKLMLEDVGFALFVGQCLDKVNALHEERLRAAEKN